MSRYSAEHLEVLGKNASVRFRSGQAATLTEAVIDTVKTAGLLPEQVMRVVEFANTDAFLTEFRKEGSSKVVDLAGGPASPHAVLQSLNQPATPALYDRGTTDYNHPPPEKRASVEELDSSLQASFKTAGAEYPYANPLGEAYALQQKLAATEETLTSQLTMLEGAFHDLLGRLYEGVKQAALEGTSLGDVVQAWSAAPQATPEHVKVAFGFLSTRLLEDRVFAGGDALGASLEKFAANRLVNLEHPMVIDFGEFCEVATKLASIRGARQEISSGLGQISHFLKHAVDQGLIRQVYGVTGSAGKAVGGAAESAAKFMLGPSSKAAPVIGKAVGGTVKHSPLIGAAVVGNEVRRTLKHNPTFQGAKDTALSVVPGTPQYQQREMELASGGGGYAMPMGY